MSTKGKTWKWKKDAKRKWYWSDRAKENITKYHSNDKRVKKCFGWMWRRCIDNNRRCDFPRTKIGFEEFCNEIGPIPKDIKRPSVGRKNHDKGYVYGNIKWEEYEYNVWKNRRAEKTMEQEREDEIPF